MQGDEQSGTDVPKEVIVDLVDMAPKEVDDFAFMDEKDIKQIQEEMEGALLKEYVYSFCRTHKDRGCMCPVRNLVVGLSYAGVKRIVQQRGNIITELVYHNSDRPEDKTYKMIFKATDTIKGITAYGSAEEPKTRGANEDNRFAYATCLNKAQRNSWRALIPEDMALALIKAHLTKKGIKLK